MNPSQCPRRRQQARVSHRASNANAFAFFNLLTGPKLLDRVEARLPEQRERKFPPTQALSMSIAQALSADGSCQQALNDYLVKRAMAGRHRGKSDRIPAACESEKGTGLSRAAPGGGAVPEHRGAD